MKDFFNIERSPIWNLIKTKTVIPEIAKVKRSGYSGAMTGRTTNDWTTSSAGSIDNAIRGSYRQVRARAEEEFRNGNGSHAVRCFKNDIIGEGVPMESQVVLANGDLDDSTNEMIEEEWEEWCLAKNCHVAGLLHFNEIEKMAVHHPAVSGDALIRLVREPFGNSKIPLALEFIPGRQLADDWNGKTNNGDEIRLGVEIDKWKRPIAYHVRGWDPGDYSFNNTTKNLLTPERSLSEDIIHIYRSDDIGQVRGISWFFPTLLRSHHIKEFEEALLIRARLEACIMGLITTPDPVSDQDFYDRTKVSEYLEPGVYKQMNPGENLIPFIPSASGANSLPFLDYCNRMAAIALGIAPGKYSGNIKDYNYSGMRGEEMLFRDNWKFERLRYIKMLHQRVFETWLDAAVLAGVVKIRNYFSDRRKYNRPHWYPRRFSYVDPQKEVQANAEALESGQSTISDTLAEYGHNIEDYLKTRAREQKLADKYGVDISGYYTKGGQNQNANITEANNSDSGQTANPAQAVGNQED